MFQAGDDLLKPRDDASTRSHEKGPKNVQPFLLCVKVCDGIFNYFLKIDQHVFSVGHPSMRAIDILIKTHYVFDVKFSSDLVNFYNFITGCIMNIDEPTMCCNALNTTLWNINRTRCVCTYIYL